MTRYIAIRLVLMLLTLFGVCTVTFFLSRVLPGSPAELLVGDRPTVEQLARARAELRLDEPLIVQYGAYLEDLVQGDFGKSLRTGRPVLEDVLSRVGATLELTTLAIIIVVLVGIPLGVLSAVRQNSMLDNFVRAQSIAGMAMPAFIVAMGLQLIFNGALGWLPLQGRIDAIVWIESPIQTITGFFLFDSAFTGNWIAFRSAVEHLVLPVLTLAAMTLASVTRITRNTMIEVLKEDHVRTGFAFGLPRRTVYFRYALKAVLIPLLTTVGLTYGYLLGGAVIIEFIFDWPGLGGQLVFAVSQNDFPATLGFTLFLATLFLTVNFVVDLLYFVGDPRLRRT